MKRAIDKSSNWAYTVKSFIARDRVVLADVPSIDEREDSALEHWRQSGRVSPQGEMS
ncbi:MAG: hypothetical protein AAF664_06560 [Planctomycetota bacterium]